MRPVKRIAACPGAGSLGRQVHDRLPVRAQRGVQRVVRRNLLGPRMQCARPLQVVGHPAQQHVPLGAGLGNALQDVVAGLPQRVAHQIGMGRELLVQPAAPQPLPHERELDAQLLEPLFLGGVVVDRHQQVPVVGLMASRRDQRPLHLTAAPGGHTAGERLRLVDDELTVLGVLEQVPAAVPAAAVDRPRPLAQTQNQHGHQRLGHLRALGRQSVPRNSHHAPTLRTPP